MISYALAADPVNQAPIATQAIGKSIGALDTSLWGLIANAGPVVQLVMLVLFMGSITSWAIVFNKYRQLKKLSKDKNTFEETFWEGGSLDALFDHVARNPQDPYEEVFSTGMREWRESSSKNKNILNHQGSAVLSRMERMMDLSMNKEMDSLHKGMTYLATLASSAPFIGLFGTVWGIMNSFQAIAVHQNTNLAVVAPGIAEALFTTAMGLLAAIPASIFYNKLSRNINKYALGLSSFIDEFMTIAAKQMEYLTTEKTQPNKSTHSF